VLLGKGLRDLPGSPCFEYLSLFAIQVEAGYAGRVQGSASSDLFSRKVLLDRADSFDSVPVWRGLAFGTAALNVGQGQRMGEVPAFLRPAAVLDHIALAVTWWRIAPMARVPSGTLCLLHLPLPITADS
jgi:hypothetical protein